VVRSLTTTESFRLAHEILPGADRRILRDLVEGWTLYRHFLAPTEADSMASPDSGYWSPVYHVTPTSLTSFDFAMGNAYCLRHPPFGDMLVCSWIVKGKEAEGWRRTLVYDGEAERSGKQARIYTREGVRGTIVEEKTVSLRRGDILRTLREEFGFLD
jgi:hypothetical protein